MYPLDALKALADETRLRLISLMKAGELTVSELVQILDQSQPRVSRHLRLLNEAGLISRFQEGTWVFYHLARSKQAQALLQPVLSQIELEREPYASDLQGLDYIRKARAERAQQYFSANANIWADIRSLYVPEQDVESVLLKRAEAGAGDKILDVGTGTGRMLELFAPHVSEGLGLDISPEMLSAARDNLSREGFAHIQFRRGDMYEMDLEAASQTIVLYHQVLHYAEDPARAIAEGARVLAAKGRFIIADFAPHKEESLRLEHAHRRLGFHDWELEAWAATAGLKPVSTDVLDGGQLTVKVWTFEKLDSPAVVPLPNRQTSSKNEVA